MSFCNKNKNENFNFLHRFLNELKISATASLPEILEAMKSPVNGINFLAKSQSLPSWTFVLMDAITWLQNRIDGKINPLEMLESMKKLVKMW